MAPQSTIICIDNSEFSRNADFAPTRLRAQQEAVYAILRAKFRANPEDDIGLLTIAGRAPESISPVTREAVTLQRKLFALRPEGSANFRVALHIAKFMLKHRPNRRHEPRVILLFGSPLRIADMGEPARTRIAAIGEQFRKSNIKLDIVLFGCAEEIAAASEIFRPLVAKLGDDSCQVICAKSSAESSSSPSLLDSMFERLRSLSRISPHRPVSPTAAAAAAAAANSSITGGENSQIASNDLDDRDLQYAIQLSLLEQQKSEATTAVVPETKSKILPKSKLNESAEKRKDTNLDQNRPKEQMKLSVPGKDNGVEGGALSKVIDLFKQAQLIKNLQMKKTSNNNKNNLFNFDHATRKFTFGRPLNSSESQTYSSSSSSSKSLSPFSRSYLMKRSKNDRNPKQNSDNQNGNRNNQNSKSKKISKGLNRMIKWPRLEEIIRSSKQQHHHNAKSQKKQNQQKKQKQKQISFFESKQKKSSLSSPGVIGKRELGKNDKRIIESKLPPSASGISTSHKSSILKSEKNKSQIDLRLSSPQIEKKPKEMVNLKQESVSSKPTSSSDSDLKSSFSIMKEEKIQNQNQKQPDQQQPSPLMGKKIEELINSKVKFLKQECADKLISVHERSRSEKQELPVEEFKSTLSRIDLVKSGELKSKSNLEKKIDMIQQEQRQPLPSLSFGKKIEKTINSKVDMLDQKSAGKLIESKNSKLDCSSWRALPPLQNQQQQQQPQKIKIKPDEPVIHQHQIKTTQISTPIRRQTIRLKMVNSKSEIDEKIDDGEKKTKAIDSILNAKNERPTLKVMKMRRSSESKFALTKEESFKSTTSRIDKFVKDSANKSDDSKSKS